MIAPFHRACSGAAPQMDVHGDTYVARHRETYPGKEPARLYPELFEWYMYRWIMQEIADYGLRLIDHPGSAASDEHNWQEFRQYLPIQPEEMRASVDGIRSVLAL